LLIAQCVSCVRWLARGESGDSSRPVPRGRPTLQSVSLGLLALSASLGLVALSASGLFVRIVHPVVNFGLLRASMAARRGVLVGLPRRVALPRGTDGTRCQALRIPALPAFEQGTLVAGHHTTESLDDQESIRR
jgi:hypothetical protein